VVEKQSVTKLFHYVAWVSDVYFIFVWSVHISEQKVRLWMLYSYTQFFIDTFDFKMLVKALKNSYSAIRIINRISSV